MHAAHKDTVDTHRDRSGDDYDDQEDNEAGNVSLSVRSEGINTMPPPGGSQVVMGMNENK